MTICKLCNKFASDGVHLSNGSAIHEECLNAIEEEIRSCRTEIVTKDSESKRLRGELNKREGVGFKILSVFSKPKVSVTEVEKSLLQIKRNIEELDNLAVSIQSKLTPIFDYFLTYPPDWEKRRKVVKERDGSQCSKCGSGNHIHLHHIIPLSRGGSNKASNLKFLCENCHSKAHGGRDFTCEFSSAETAFSKRVANIRYAIESGKRIKFGYKKPSDSGHKQRTVKPEELIIMDHRRNSGSTLCVQGNCELRKANRVFALKRMRGLKVL